MTGAHPYIGNVLSSPSSKQLVKIIKADPSHTPWPKCPRTFELNINKLLLKTSLKSGLQPLAVTGQ